MSKTRIYISTVPSLSASLAVILPAALAINTTIIMPGVISPPFPDNVPTHPLLVVDFELIKKEDPEEVNKLWKAATELGFCQ